MRISDWSSDVCSSDLPVPGGVQAGAELRAERLELPAEVGRIATGDDQPGTTLGTLGEVCRQFAGVPEEVLEAGVHRAHHHPVAQQIGRASGRERVWS